MAEEKQFDMLVDEVRVVHRRRVVRRAYGRSWVGLPLHFVAVFIQVADYGVSIGVCDRISERLIFAIMPANCRGDVGSLTSSCGRVGVVCVAVAARWGAKRTKPGAVMPLRWEIGKWHESEYLQND
jgi:hypothetical protein